MTLRTCRSSSGLSALAVTLSLTQPTAPLPLTCSKNMAPALTGMRAKEFAAGDSVASRQCEMLGCSS